MEIIFNLHKIKYKKLDEIITNGCKEINPSSKVNLFINLDNIFIRLADANLESRLQLTEERKCFELISNIINLAAHYRKFFSNNGIYSRVYLYSSYPFNATYRNFQYNQEYRSFYNNKFTKNPSNFLLYKTINDNFSICKLFLEYVEGVYLIQSDTIENSVVPLIISEFLKDNYLNFLLTDDIYEYQYVNKGFYILKPRQDESVLINKENLWDIISKGELKNCKLNLGVYPFILSVLGDKRRSLEKVRGLGLKTTTKAIQTAVDKNIISSDANNIAILIRLIKEEYVDLVLSNYSCTNIDVQYRQLNTASIMYITNQLVDKFDNMGLQQINNDYFKEHPINLMEITDATKLLKSNKRIIF